MSARVALVHERLTDIAGSEHVVAAMAEEWPDARIHVPFARAEGTPAHLADRVRTGPLQRPYTALRGRSHAPLLPAVPWALGRADLDPRALDAVVVSHHAFALSALGALVGTDLPTVAYVHSPARWAWDAGFRANEADGLAGRAALSGLAAVALRNEKRWAPRVGRIVANSTAVQQRIESWWNRDSVVVHPPVDTGYFAAAREGGASDEPAARDDYFVIVGRLVPYKRVDLAVAAAVEAGVRLVVVGDGRDSARVRTAAGDSTHIEFRGHLARAEMRNVVRGARALLMPGIEDFGIVPVEAMAAGTPVIALAEGGALDTVVPGRSGVLVPAPAPEFIGAARDAEVVHGFAEALRAFDDAAFAPADLSAYAESFSVASFRARFAEVVDSVA